MKASSLVKTATLALLFASTPVLAAKGGNGPFGGGTGNTNGGPVVTPRGVPASGPRVCALSDLSPGATACTGFIAGNLLSGATTAEQQSALAAIGFGWNADFSKVTKINSLGGSLLVNFASADLNPIIKLFGDTFVGVHFGSGADLGGQATAFYRFNAGKTGLTSFLLTIAKGSSGAVLYKTGIAPEAQPSDLGTPGAVPEPATWAMFILGFGALGVVARRRRARNDICLSGSSPSHP